MKIREACKKLTTAAKRSANCQIPSPWGRFHFPEYLYLSFERCYEHFMELYVEVDAIGESSSTRGSSGCGVLSPSLVHRGCLAQEQHRALCPWGLSLGSRAVWLGRAGEEMERGRGGGDGFTMHSQPHRDILGLSTWCPAKGPPLPVFLQERAVHPAAPLRDGTARHHNREPSRAAGAGPPRPCPPKRQHRARGGLLEQSASPLPLTGLVSHHLSKRGCSKVLLSACFNEPC